MSRRDTFAARGEPRGGRRTTAPPPPRRPLPSSSPPAPHRLPGALPSWFRRPPAACSHLP